MITPKEAAEQFLKAHTELLEIAEALAPIEREHLSLDGLGSAGIEATGQMPFFEERSKRRWEIVEELKQLRSEVGDDALIAELRLLNEPQRAVEYVRKVPLRDATQEAAAVPDEKRPGFFSRLWRK